MRTKSTLFGVVALSVGMLAASILFRTEPGAGASPEAGAKKPTAVLLTGYQNWTKVNPERAQVVSYIALLCRLPSDEEVEREKTNPHNDKFITVYVNPTGRKAMMEQKLPRFPTGSVIVKEKHPTETSETPELLTVMRKREKGYNPAHGDWEYLVLDGMAKKVQGAGKLEKCQSCHDQWKVGDYISRRYLPYATWQALR